ncbi:MAG: non-heme iron oxygenase ferredoxin subunit [Nitrosopumilus sp. H8]|nr:MAG: non-heme iron oxygenase ferredoxin subunit [Nitrosopumilus sp. H13]RNJ79644.1 MAG: non-heme iron oxygenase ferredoxin subunit [Nitrosopumilus sp. H8]
MPEWIKVCSLEDVGDGQLLGRDCGEKKILVANIGGKIHATDRICTHADADLANGITSPEGVRCPLHLSVFDMESGAPQNPPAEAPLRVYNVKIDDGQIYVEA